jgi:F-type H+-transporting ATPase subunit b
MSSTLQALVDLLIRSVPTIIFFIVLTYYLKYMFFRPLQKVLDERRKATEGVRGLASEANEAADRQLSEFEQALQHARNEIYKYNDDLRRQWNEEQLVLLDQARAEAAEKLKAAKQLINEELEQAEAELSASIEPLSEEIVQTLLRRRAA